MKILKWRLDKVTGHQEIKCSKNSIIRAFQEQDGELMIWTENIETDQTENLKVFLGFTGQELPDDQNLVHLGTVQCSAPHGLVYHLFQVCK